MESVRDDELRGFLTYVIDLLEHLRIPYMIVGGFAAILYGEPRSPLANKRMEPTRPSVRKRPPAPLGCRFVLRPIDFWVYMV